MNLSQVLPLVVILLLLVVLIFRIPELGLVLCFVASSLFKGMVQPLLGPIDLTVYLFAVTYGSIFIHCLRSHSFVLPDRKINISIGLLLALLLASLFYTPLPSQGTDIYLRFIFLTVSIMYATFIWCNNNIERIKRVLSIFTWISLGYGAVLLCWILLLQPTDLFNPVRAALQQTPPLAVAQIIAPGIIIAFILRDFLYNKYKRIALNVLMLVGIVELVALNSRGPLIAFIVGGIALFILYPRQQRKQLVIPYIIGIATMILAFLFLPEQFTARYALLADPQSPSIAWRLNAWWFVIKHIPDWFFTGAGIFGFAYYYLPGQEWSIFGAYPHNIFLDIFADAGIFALLAFIGFIYMLLHKGIKMIRPVLNFQSTGSTALIAITAIVVLMTAYQFSGSIIGTRGLWLFAGLLLATEKLWKQGMHTRSGGTLGESAMKACILTSVHPPFDTRIFHKEAKTLEKAGYDVTLVAQHDRNETVDGIKIVSLPKVHNRAKRILGTLRVLKLALEQKAYIYHFHDPELLPVGLLLKILTRGKVIYDVHENIKGDIETKAWLPKSTRRFVSIIFQLIEKLSLIFIDEIIIAENSYIINYSKYSNIVILRNYPILPSFKENPEINISRPTLIYVGGIGEANGVYELIESIKLLKVKYPDILLELVGRIVPVKLEAIIKLKVKDNNIKGNILLVGKVNYTKIYNILFNCHIGMAILHPIPNYRESLATKLYEYMAAGLPVIASNFPLWKEIVEGNKCGLTVNPLDPKEIARAVEYLIEHPNEAKQMGENGRKAVIEKYNWENESRKLIALYGKLEEAQKLKSKEMRIDD